VVREEKVYQYFSTPVFDPFFVLVSIYCSYLGFDDD